MRHPPVPSPARPTHASAPTVKRETRAASPAQSANFQETAKQTLGRCVSPARDRALGPSVRANRSRDPKQAATRAGRGIPWRKVRRTFANPLHGGSSVLMVDVRDQRLPCFAGYWCRRVRPPTGGEGGNRWGLVGGDQKVRRRLIAISCGVFHVLYCGRRRRAQEALALKRGE